MTTASDKLKDYAPLREHLAKCKGGPNQSQNLHQHFTDIMSHIVIHCPQDALNNIEEISYLLKNKNTLNMEDYLNIKIENKYAKPSDESTKIATKDYIETSSVFFQVSIVFQID